MTLLNQYSILMNIVKNDCGMKTTRSAEGPAAGLLSFRPGSRFQKATLCPREDTAAVSGVQDIESEFRAIYDRCRGRIYAVAVRYLKSDANAQEVVQEVFMKLWMERNSIRPGTPVEAWLYTVAKNNILNKLKRKAIEWKAVNEIKAVRVTDCDDSLRRTLCEKDNQRLLKKAMASLSLNQRTVYQLAREESLSYVQIAERLKISPLTVKTHMARALAFLRASIPVS